VSHISLSMVISLLYSLWGLHRSQRNIWTLTVFSVIKELTLKKTSSYENRNGCWIRLCNSRWKSLKVLIWGVNDWKVVQTQYSPIHPLAPNVKTAEGNGQIAWINLFFYYTLISKQKTLHTFLWANALTLLAVV